LDALAVHQAVREVSDYVRSERQPYLLEVMTYRYRAHSMADPEHYREKGEVEEWRRRDAIDRLESQLVEAELMDDAAWEAMRADNETIVAAAVEFANASPHPDEAELFMDIIAEPPPAQEPAEGAATSELTTADALNAALDDYMGENAASFKMGEDIDDYGGAYAVTRGLPEKYGESRVIDTPIAEGAICGIATGAAMAGLRPIAELMTINFALLATDAIINHAAKIRSMFGGQASVPLVVRTNAGGVQLAATHSQHFYQMFAHVPGLRVAVPATPYDAKGLLATALRLEDPTVFIEHQLLYRMKGEVPDEHYTLPVGKACVEREGSPGGVTLVGYARSVHFALEAAEILAKEHGIEAEVINLRWLRPLDTDTVVESVKKTNRCLIVEDDWRSYGAGAEIAARIQEAAFDWLDAPVMRVGGAEAPMPYAANLERAAWPSAAKIIDALRAQNIL
jgi:pyruvate/2-oxoglutarate/acetoin dehydrogenase E1 component